MRYGILGDIHSNLSALETVLAEIEREGVDRVLSVGDVVGYGAAPRECIQILRELKAVVVKGNHDAACTGELDMKFFNPYARAAVEWTRTEITADDLAWLGELPLVAHEPHCSVAHGTLADPEFYEYIQSTEDADPSLDMLEEGVCFVGHTHVPVTILRPTDDPTHTGYTVETDIDLSDVSRALVNVGSVGQPRDEDPRTIYALYDSDEARVQLRRIDYDIEREAKRIRDAGLPNVLAERLFLGI
jgi:diadenosine tetraphosphatase ApaH/serine/threonine PP2A family protein phosphatase